MRMGLLSLGHHSRGNRAHVTALMNDSMMLERVATAVERLHLDLVVHREDSIRQEEVVVDLLASVEVDG